MMSEPGQPVAPETPKPLSWADITELRSERIPLHLSYGQADSQFGRLFLPSGQGPFPVVVLIHGGCWLSGYSLDYFDHWAAWFADQGYASWSIEYRRLGQAGGGWPGTFVDVAGAMDHLRQLAPEHSLDLGQVTVLGHSAGGQLALWLAARGKLAADSELWSVEPLLPKRVIGLAAITDMMDYRIGPPGSCHASVEALLGGPPDQVLSRYRESSPIEQLPLAASVHLISGEQDSIVSPDSADRYREQALEYGMDVQHFILPGAGHFDTGVPTAASIWAMCRVLGACR